MAARLDLGFLQWQLSAAEARGDVAALTEFLCRNRYQRVPHLQQQAAGALVRLLQTGGAAAAAACASAGAANAVSALLQSAPAHAGLLLECLRLLRLLRTHAYAYPLSINASLRGISGAVAALRAHGAAHAELAREACGLIAALTTRMYAPRTDPEWIWSTAVAHAVRAGAVPALLGVLAAHSERDAAVAVARARETLAAADSACGLPAEAPHAAAVRHGAHARARRAHPRLSARARQGCFVLRTHAWVAGATTISASVPQHWRPRSSPLTDLVTPT
jgi:hypothetical protein